MIYSVWLLAVHSLCYLFFLLIDLFYVVLGHWFNRSYTTQFNRAYTLPRPAVKPYWIACMIIIVQLIHHQCLCKVKVRHQEWKLMMIHKNCPLNKRPLGKGHNLFDVRMRLTNTWWMIVKVKIRKTSIYLVGGSLILVSIVYYLNWHWMYWMYRFSTSTLLLISSFCVKFWVFKFAGEVASHIE